MDTDITDIPGGHGVVLGETRSQDAPSSKIAWRGRSRHSVHTRHWLKRLKNRCGNWPGDGLDDEAIMLLVDALPFLAHTQDARYQPSIDVLMAQNPHKLWREAIGRRVAMIKREATPGLRGDLILMAARRDAWSAHRTQDGSWRMRDGTDLDTFLVRGRSGRRSVLEAAVALPGLTAVEIPTCHLVWATWAQALREAALWLRQPHPVFAQALSEGRTWQLAVRRIQRLRVRGVFDAATQTVVVDPRHPDTLQHELAHWLLRHDDTTPARKAEAQVERLLAKTRLKLPRNHKETP